MTTARVPRLAFVWRTSVVRLYRSSGRLEQLQAAGHALVIGEVGLEDLLPRAVREHDESDVAVPGDVDEVAEASSGVWRRA